MSKRTLNPVIFRSWLIKVVKDGTKRSDYKEISHLLDLAYEAHGQEPPMLGADGLRKAYQRYVENPDQMGFPDAEWRNKLIVGVIVGAFFCAIAKAKDDPSFKPTTDANYTPL